MIQDIDSFPFANVKYTLPKKASPTHYSVCAHLVDEHGVSGEKIYVQTPKMTLQSDVFQQDSQELNPFIDLSCEDETFVKWIKGLDTHMFNVIKEHRTDWFPNKTIEDTFMEMGQTHSLMINNVLRARTDKNLEIFNTRKETVSPSDIVAKSVVRCILQFVGIWITATRWGVTWKVVQILHYPERKSKSVPQTLGYMFPDEDSASDNEDDSPMPPPGV